MGLFLAMSGVIGADTTAVVNALGAYAQEHHGTVAPESLTTEDEGCLVLSESVGGCTALYPFGFFEWDDASQFLSSHLRKPVFSFHIHDSDLWMYVLYADGEDVDQFNPVPDYWQELDDTERVLWRGNASAVCRAVPGLDPERIAEYLIEWGDDVFESDDRRKAYATDEYRYGDDWQLVDFMKRLGLDPPIDDRGHIHGETYRFRCEPHDAD